MSREILQTADILKAAQELPTRELPALIGQLEAAKATAWARLANLPQAQPKHDELLGVAEAAWRLGVSQDYLCSLLAFRKL